MKRAQRTTKKKRKIWIYNINNMESQVKVLATQRRLLFLSPSVKAGTERECTVDDFVSLSERSIGKGAFGEVYKVKHKLSGEVRGI